MKCPWQNKDLKELKSVYESANKIVLLFLAMEDIVNFGSQPLYRQLS
jgi:hypothetical protein